MRRRKAPRPATEPDLARALGGVKAEYMGFVQTQEADAKAFGARHAAAKTALSHIEQLLKISGASEEEAAETLDECRAALCDARREIEDLPEEMPPDDDGDLG